MPVSGRRHTPTWLLLLEFMGAAIVVAMLVAGPQIFEASGKLKDQVQRYLNHHSSPANPVSPLRIAPPVKVPVNPPPVRTVSPPRTPASAAVPAQMPVPTAAPVSTAEPPKPATQQNAVQPPRKIATRPQADSAAVVKGRLIVASDNAAAAGVPSALSPQQYYDALMRQGYQLYQSGWYGPAMGRFRQAVLVMPSSPSPLLWQARSAMKVGRYGEARQALERAIALAPASDAAREARVMLDWFK